MNSIRSLPDFTDGGLLPPGDYPLALEELRESFLVSGPSSGYPTWDAGWRLRLVENLAILARQLWQVGITRIFVDGSFVEDKDHPNDIDGYFECGLAELASGELQRALNALDPFKVWTWDPRDAQAIPRLPEASASDGTPLSCGTVPSLWIRTLVRDPRQARQ